MRTLFHYVRLMLPPIIATVMFQGVLIWGFIAFLSFTLIFTPGVVAPPRLVLIAIGSLLAFIISLIAFCGWALGWAEGD